MRQNNLSSFTKFSYFPGCSMITTAKESGQALEASCEKLGIILEEIPDWNCCGSSSTHMLKRDLSLKIAARNLALASPDRPIVVMCPSCLHNLKRTSHQLKKDMELHKKIEDSLQKKVYLDHKIVHLLEVLAQWDIKKIQSILEKPLKDIKIAPYYGCMLASPNVMLHEHGYPLSIETTLKALGASIVLWPDIRGCCGTFLSVTKPDVSSKAVQRIIYNAKNSGAQCIVTACAMCQLNLEIRAPKKDKIPVFHYIELLAFALGAPEWKNWLKYHLIDPYPILEKAE